MRFYVTLAALLTFLIGASANKIGGNKVSGVDYPVKLNIPSGHKNHKKLPKAMISHKHDKHHVKSHEEQELEEHFQIYLQSFPEGEPSIEDLEAMNVQWKLHDWKDELRHNFLQEHKGDSIDKLDDLASYDRKDEL